MESIRKTWFEKTKSISKRRKSELHACRRILRRLLKNQPSILHRKNLAKIRRMSYSDAKSYACLLGDLLVVPDLYGMTESSAKDYLSIYRL